jgi:hypothetical protein
MMFSGQLLTVFILGFQVEFFLSLCYEYSVFFVKGLFFSKAIQKEQPNPVFSVNVLFGVFLSFVFLFTKGTASLYVYLWVFYCVIFICLAKFVHYSNIYSRNAGYFAQIFIFITISSFYFILQLKSFLTLFFFIEIYGAIYYFCFLSSYTFTNQTALQYKNGLMLLLWNNFLTTFFLAIGCYFLIKASGTSQFLELAEVTPTNPYVYLYLIGIGWKLGLPIFHFFKLEVYTFLLKENVFLFSIITVLVNLTILFFCLTQPIIYNTLFLNNFLFIMFLFVLMLLCINLKVTSILYFYALSSALTLATVLVLFLIIVCMYI